MKYVVSLLFACLTLAALAAPRPVRYFPAASFAAAPTEPFVYYTNPVTAWLWYDGVTNATGARNAGTGAAHGYIIGATQAVCGINTDGKTNWGFFVDGVDDYITNALAFRPSGASAPYVDYHYFEQSAWVKSTRTYPESETVNGYPFSRCKGVGSRSLALAGTLGAGGLTNTVFVYDNTLLYTSTVSIATNEWHHLAYVHDVGNKISYYLDGEPILTNQTAAGDLWTFAQASNFVVGARANDLSLPFKGYITTVTCYSATNLTYAQRTNFVAQSNPTNSHLEVIAP